MINLKAKGIKVSLPLDQDSFHTVLTVDTIGLKSLPVTIEAEGVQYEAVLNPKTFRKNVETFKAAKDPTVILSGTLKGNRIETAGIQVFDKSGEQ